MKYPTALFIKFLMVTGILWIVLGLFYQVSFSNILLLSIILTLVAFAGDVYILPNIGNIVGVIADFALAYLAIWMIGIYFLNIPINWPTAAFISAIFIAIGEIFFHRIMEKNVFKKRTAKIYHLQTEAGEEIRPEIKNEDNDK